MTTISLLNFSHKKDNYIYIEFIDSALIDNPKEYIKRAYKYFENTSRNLFNERNYDDIDIGVMIKNYYLDVLDAYVDKKLFARIFVNIDSISCFFVKGYHRRYHNKLGRKDLNNIILLEKCFDAKYVESKEQINWQSDNKSDCIEISKIETQDKKVEEIKNELNLLLSSAEKIHSVDKIIEGAKGGKHRNCKFRVYNVGQALSTLLSLEEEPPFLYIDYGIPYGRNAKV